MSKMTVHVTVV